VLGGVLQEFPKPPPLRVLIDSPQEIPDRGPLLGEITLDFIYRGEPNRPGLLVDQSLDPGDEEVLEMTPEEHDDLAPPWRVPMHAPQWIVREFLQGWGLKWVALDALRIYPLENDPNPPPVLPAGDHALQSGADPVVPIGEAELL
jgi:hypothetical protein